MDDQPADADQAARDVERGAEPEEHRGVSAHQRAERGAGDDGGLHHAERVGRTLRRGLARDQRHARRHRARQRPLDDAQDQQLVHVLDQPHERDDHRAGDHRAQHHDLPPVAVRQVAPDEREDRHRQPDGRHEDAGPLDRLVLGNAQVLDDVERQERHDERKARHRDELRRAHRVERLSPRNHSVSGPIRKAAAPFSATVASQRSPGSQSSHGNSARSHDHRRIIQPAGRTRQDERGDPGTRLPQGRLSRSRARSDLTIMATSSSNRTVGFQPRARCAFDASPMSSSTSAGR